MGAAKKNALALAREAAKNPGLTLDQAALAVVRVALHRATEEKEPGQKEHDVSVRDLADVLEAAASFRKVGGGDTDDADGWDENAETPPPHPAVG